MGSFVFLVFVQITCSGMIGGPQRDKICQFPIPEAVSITSDGTNVIELRVLRGGVYPGLSGWALNTTTCILIREKQRQTQREDSKKIGRDWSNAASSQRTLAPPEAGRGEEWIIPRGTCAEQNPARSGTSVK